jgi:hypothetical protein
MWYFCEGISGHTCLKHFALLLVMKFEMKSFVEGYSSDMEYAPDPLT